jgi:ABC-type nitrate/sulfonate/bicarbonate transport system permease component
MFRFRRNGTGSTTGWSWNTRLIGVAFIGGLLVLWEIAAAKAIFPPMSFPRVSAILVTWWQLVVSGELPGEVLSSLWRVFAGYAIGVALGVGLGLLMGYVRFFYSGVRSVDPIQLQTARTFGVTGRRLLTQVVLPAASPYIFTGMRVSLAVALIVMVISEMVAASSGIGYFILSAQRGFKIRDMFAGVLTLALLGYALNRLFLAIENRVLAWHYGYTQQRS